MHKEKILNITLPIYNMAVSKQVAKALPRPNYDKYEELVNYIIYKAGSLPNFGLTLLYKILYFIDFDFYELFERSVTNESYRKLDNGPAPCHIEKVLDRLVKNEKIIPVKIKYFNYDQKKFITKKPPLLKWLDGEEMEITNKVIQRFSTMSAKQASGYSHLDTPWKVTENKGIIDYELVFYRAPITSVSE